MSNLKKTILVVEDELHLAKGLKLNLELLGHQVLLAEDGLKGLKLWEKERPDLVILDLMMPEMDGHQVLREIRKNDFRSPVLILSAKNTAIDKIQAFKVGVDDFLDKPFNLDELLLRVERLLVRGEWAKENINTLKDKDQFSFGKNTVFFTTQKAQTYQGEIDLTLQEVRVLRLLMNNSGVPLNRKQLLEAGWDYSQNTNSRTLDNFMVRFRKYFEKDPKHPIHFKSVRGVGYQFDPGEKE